MSKMSVPNCRCGANDWIAIRHDHVVSNAPLRSDGSLGEEEEVDADLEQLDFQCDQCRELADGRLAQVLERVYHA